MGLEVINIRKFIKICLFNQVAAEIVQTKYKRKSVRTN